MAEMHVQDFAKIMRRAHTKALRQWQNAGVEDTAEFTGAVILLSFIADAAKQM